MRGLLIAFALLCAQPASAADQLPQTLALLRQVAVTPPSADVPADIAAFSGKWEGLRESDGRRRVLIVEWLRAAGQASVVHGWADVDKPQDVKAYRYKATVEDGILRFGESGPDQYELAFAKEGQLYGKIFQKKVAQPWGEITMVRGEPTPSARSSAGASEQLPTDLTLLRQLQVAPPGPYVPAEIAAFSGKWEGFNFSGGRRILVVEWLLSSGQASVVYGYANVASTEQVKMPEYIYRIKARVRNGTLQYTTSKGFEYSFAFVSGELHVKVVKEGLELMGFSPVVMTRGEPTFPSPESRGIYANEEAERECKKYIPSRFLDIDYYDSAPGRAAYVSQMVYEFPLGSVKLQKGACAARAIRHKTSDSGKKLPPVIAVVEVDPDGSVHFLGGGVKEVSASGEKIYRYQYIDSKKEWVIYKEPERDATSHKATWRSQ